MGPADWVSDAKSDIKDFRKLANLISLRRDVSEKEDFVQWCDELCDSYLVFLYYKVKSLKLKSTDIHAKLKLRSLDRAIRDSGDLLLEVMTTELDL